MASKDMMDRAATNGEASDVVESQSDKAEDALDLMLSGAPKGSARVRYRFAKERAFPLLARVEDAGERGAALKDVAKSLDLGIRELRGAFEEFENELRPGQDHDEKDDSEADDLLPEPGSERHEHAMTLLQSPDILERANRDLTRLGHIGESIPKKLLLVCVLSARAGIPIQPAILAESSSGKNFLADKVLSLLPQEMVIRRSAISAKALYRTSESLVGRVLYLQEHKGSEDADFTFRVIQSDNKLVYEATEQGPDGGFRTVVHEKEGPLVILQTSTELRLYDENDTRVCSIYLDESKEQTKRITDHAKHLAANGGMSREERDAILEVWHDAIGLLESVDVIIPFAERIDAPSRLVRMRRDINRLLDVIRVLSWLHQHNRRRDHLGRILATEEDFHMALSLIGDSLWRAWGSMTPIEEAVMGAIGSLPEAVRKNGFKRSELPLPGHDARRVQDALKALTETGHIECERKGGPGGYRYTVPRDREIVGLGISLRSSDGEGAEAGDNEDEEEEGERERGSRESARNRNRAIESDTLRGEDVIARSREEDDEDDFEADQSAEDEDNIDHIGELTERSWYRAQIAFAAEDVPEDYSVGEDPVGRWLRHQTPIYYGPRSEEFLDCGPANPLVFSAEELIEEWAKGDLQEEERPTPWPITPEEASRRVNWIVPVLQAKVHRFWDPRFSSWYITELLWHPNDTEKVCSEAYLHAELWKNEETQEKLWVLVALREGWRVPDEAIEEAVWRRVTFGPRTWEDNVFDSSPEEDAEFEL